VTGRRPQPGAACFLGEGFRAHAASQGLPDSGHERAHGPTSIAVGKGSLATSGGVKGVPELLNHGSVDVCASPMRQELMPGMPTATRRAATSATGSAARPPAAIDIASVTMMDTTTLRVLGFIRMPSTNGAVCTARIMTGARDRGVIAA
jgi:hypothetical protein